MFQLEIGLNTLAHTVSSEQKQLHSLVQMLRSSTGITVLKDPILTPPPPPQSCLDDQVHEENQHPGHDQEPYQCDDIAVVCDGFLQAVDSLLQAADALIEARHEEHEVP